jgi:uncharacterized tellurite resistance protein B-like protein
MVIHSTFKDFILFLYVHISRADEVYDPNEMATIKKKISELLNKDADIERKLYQAIREYNTFDKAHLTTLFKSSFKHFSKDALALNSNFYNDLNEIALADGKVEDAETKALGMLREIIDMKQ